MTSERNEALTDLIERVGGLTGAEQALLSKLAHAAYGTMSHYFLGFPNEKMLRKLDAEGLIDQGDALSAKPVAITEAGRRALSASKGDTV
jgi:hypothetical protein